LKFIWICTIIFTIGEKNRMKANSTPVRPPSHIDGNVAESKIMTTFQKWGWNAEKVSNDYGEDLGCTIFIDYQRTELYFRTQIKSFRPEKRYVKVLSGGSFSVQVKTSICKAWFSSYFPVFLIVYDQSTNTAFWTNATKQIREKVASFSKKTMTIRIARASSLQGSQKDIISEVQDFYDSLLRLHAPAIECEIFPVLMPGYRVLPMIQVIKSIKKLVSPKLNLVFTNRAIDSLPAWVNSLHFLDLLYICGWKLKCERVNLNSFLEKLKELLCRIANSLPLPDADWLSFVCSPVKFSTDREEKKKSASLKRRLTDWLSYSRINGKIVEDVKYAFEIPKGFRKQIDQRAGSWDTFHLVNPNQDVSIQLFAGTPCTPGYSALVETSQKHILGQFMPWSCLVKEVDELRKILDTMLLDFREIDGINFGTQEVVGIISDRRFDPSLGVFMQAIDWEEFENRSVRRQLEEQGVLPILPGKEGPPVVKDLILSMFGESLKTAQKQYLVTQRDFTPGLPLDHSQRVIQVQRFHIVKEAYLKIVRASEESFKKKLTSIMKGLQNVHIECNLHEDLDNSIIIELSLSWTPPLNQSSVSSYDQLLSGILKEFDGILPRRNSAVKGPFATFDVLRLYGELYFEGD
jgi:hypothetical protein